MYANSEHESQDRVDRSCRQSISIARSMAKIGSRIDSDSGITMGREIDRKSPWDIPLSTRRQQWGIDRGINRQIKIGRGIEKSGIGRKINKGS